MPTVPFLSTLGNFVQETISTNVAKVLVGNVTDIFRGYKRYRNIACVGVMTLAGAGGVPAFILIPDIHDYFYPIVKETIPFLGKVGNNIGVGIIGFWICAAVGYNVAKFVYREVSERKNGHTNTEYAITDENVTKIVDANPIVYSYEKTPEGQLTPAAQNKRAGDIQDLKAMLKVIRGKISEYKNDGTTRHDDNKMMLLKALRTKDLTPILENAAQNTAKREVRKNYVALLAAYLSEVNFDVFKNVNQNNPLPVEADDAEELGAFAEGQDRLRAGAQIFPNTLTRLKELRQKSKIFPLWHRVSVHQDLSDPEKHGVIRDAAKVIRRETAKSFDDATLVPGDVAFKQHLRLA